jgi:4-hydroxybenzoate polyprenyltransferase
VGGGTSVNVQHQQQVEPESPHPNPSPQGRERGLSALRAYAELARLSNIPTVLSNVLVGFAIGAASSPGPVAWWPLLALVPAMVLFYVGGMALNDVVDSNIDRRERPGRPIPSGRVSMYEASVFVALCMVLGIVLVAPFGWPARFLAIALALTIIAYDITHKVTPLSGVLMGACRGLVYLTVAAAMAWPLDWAVAGPLAIAMTAYIGVMTFIARSEAVVDASSMTIMLRRRLSILLPGIAIVPVLWVVPASWDVAIIAGVVMLAWLVFAQRHLLVPQPRVKNAVLSYLAGICLIDAFYLTLLERNNLAMIAGACFIATVLWHRRVSGT